MSPPPAVLGLPDALIASGVPSWVWGALLIAAFVALSIVTMALTRIPARDEPPPFFPPEDHDGGPEEGEHERDEGDNGE